MKVKKILKNTDNRRVYNMASLFERDVWNRKEMNSLRRKHYGGYDDNLRRPNWKLQKVKKQWQVQPFKTETWKSPWSGRVWTSFEI